MKVHICSKRAMREILDGEGLPERVAVISFYSPKGGEANRIHYDGVADKHFCIGIPDIDIEILGDYGYTYESYLSEADALAKFIYDAKESGYDIICQCDYGQSRSAACAAAILQHFEGRGIDIFADYSYYPNQLVYHKIFDALEKIKGESKA